MSTLLDTSIQLLILALAGLLPASALNWLAEKLPGGEEGP